MKILLTNDDGIHAHGLRSLYKALKDAGHDVRVVAPIQEQSAVGHAITFLGPLRVFDFQEDNFEGQGVSGTPADCVKLGLTTLIEGTTDLVLSGINKGANCGVDIVYSGTVSAATEGVLMGVPSMAVSMDDFGLRDLSEQSAYAVSLLKTIPWGDIPDKTLLNLNFPQCEFKQSLGLKLCLHTRAAYHDWYERREDPRGRPYYWLDGEIPPDKISPDRDRSLLTQGWITLTPLHFDFNDLVTLEMLTKVLNA
ncbi:MAG: 5'/3'-nucleotidase SurE [Proteobacteria bacterium]|nr:5'/3'-nucleotidase SurE [Pseudomonadota bacterium]